MLMSRFLEIPDKDGEEVEGFVMSGKLRKVM